MAEKKIVGAIAIGDRTFRAGDEAALDEALQSEQGKGVDVEKHAKDGVLVGYGRGTAESVQTVNRQRDAKGKPADAKAEQQAAEAEGELANPPELTAEGTAEPLPEAQGAREAMARPASGGKAKGRK